MPRFTFEDFDFNTHTFLLTQNGVPVSLRPKTAKLLALLLVNRGKVLGKAEIIAAIWESDHVPEYALHQLVSEVRKLAKDKALIRTQPNEGYCWIAQTSRVCEGEAQSNRRRSGPPRTFWGCSIGAALAACLIVAFGAWPLGKASQQPSSLPAIRALSKGIIALEQGDQGSAIAWFEFVLAENPQAIEARLLLAESLLQQNRLQEASAYLLPMLVVTEDTDLSPTAYDKAAAAELMSRVHQRGGQYFEALEFARQSFFESRAQCTTEYLDDRIRQLSNLTGEAWKGASLPSNKQVTVFESAQSLDYQKHCQRLKRHPDNGEALLHWYSPVPEPLWAVQTGIHLAIISNSKSSDVKV